MKKRVKKRSSKSKKTSSKFSKHTKHVKKHHNNAMLIASVIVVFALFLTMKVVVDNVATQVQDDGFGFSLTGAVVFDEDSFVGEVGCFDSDGGLDLNRPGQVMVGDDVYSDTCFGTMRVKEYTCSLDGEVLEHIRSCDSRTCLNGKCFKRSD